MAVTRDQSSADANNSQNSPITSRAIKNKFELLDKKMDGIYKDIYVTRPDNRRNLDMIVDHLDDVIDRLQGLDTTTSGMSELVRRLDSKDNSASSQLMDQVQDLFNDQSVLGTLMMNDDMHRYIAGQNANYDMICKYLPKLLDALEIKKDNVLSSDSFSKDFINPKSTRSSKSEVIKFASNRKRIEKKYDLSRFLERTYMNTSKYGEDFVYVVPYPVAFERLQKKQIQRLNSGRSGQTLFEGYSVEKTLSDKYNITKDWTTYLNEAKSHLSDDDAKALDQHFPELGQINLHFNSTNVLQNAVGEMAVADNIDGLKKFESLSSIYESSILNESVVEEANRTINSTNRPTRQSKSKFNSIYDGVLKQHKKFSQNTMSAEGLIVPGLNNNEPIDKNMCGAVVERLPRENVLPVYIGKRCLGYYYFEFAEDSSACGFCGGHHAGTPGMSNMGRFSAQMTQDQQELAIRYVSSKISASIDNHFINANKDLKEDIYALLSYNEKFDVTRSNDIGVTFIPAEDIVHCYFDLDEHTHRGISDLQKSLIPAMLYILLYLTDIIGKITRSNDKRIYYVKQNVDQNTSRSLMNVVAQIRKGNMGMRQIESMNNILNIVGKYNDYIIPMGPSGDPPIDFQVMNGQDIQTPTELMEKMEEAAINPIMPFEFLSSTYQQDFATRFTMSNSRFMKSIYSRQRDTEHFFSEIYTKIYNYEFRENNSWIQVILPPPTYLVMNTNSQMIDSITQMADKIIENQMMNESEEVKAEFKNIYIRNILSTYIDFDQIDRYLDLAKMKVEADKEPAAEDGEDSEVTAMADDDF